MKNYTKYCLLVGALALGLAAFTARGQAPVIASFGSNGLLVCTNLEPGTTATVEWAPTVNGPWTNSWAGLDAVTVASNGMIQVSVPMFYRVRTGSSVPPNMVLIPAGSFTMGNCMDTNEGSADELPLHDVYISAFFMDKYEVTKALWDEVKAWADTNGYTFDNAGGGKATNHPVQTVSWYDCVKWCNARSQKEGLVPAYYTDAGLTTVHKTGQMAPYVNWSSGYRLPTEAEWEKAARGGASGHRFPWSDTDDITHGRANYYSEGSDVYDTSPTHGHHPTFATGGEPYTSPVGYFAPNGYGLHDMTGNVWEWCWDWYDANWYSKVGATQDDTRGPNPESHRVMRGGAWDDTATDTRCAVRDYCFTPSNCDNGDGFRCVRGL